MTTDDYVKALQEIKPGGILVFKAQEWDKVKEATMINSGKTHWSECWQDHRECAIAKVRSMEKRYNEVLDKLAMLAIKSEDHADLIRRIRDLLKESETK